jgi:ribosomal protein S18 acetylase RimI-like enzyme
VAASARGRGVGEALVRRCEERAAAAGASRMWLATLDEMTHAQRIYARLGYRHEQSRDWYPEPDVIPDVLLRAWTKEL